MLLKLALRDEEEGHKLYQIIVQGVELNALTLAADNSDDFRD